MLIKISHLKSVYPAKSNRIKYVHRRFRRARKKGKTFKRGKGKVSKDWKKIKFPSQVKLIKQPDEILKFFNLAYKYYHKNYNIDYDLSEIVQFSPESIAVFAACIANSNFTNGMNSKGNLPKNIFLSRVFQDSGFFEHVNLIGNRNSLKSKSSVELLHKETNFKVETEIAKTSCRYIMDKLNAPYIDDMESLYVILIEAMQNTHNHASVDSNSKYDWWLYRYEDRSKKVIHFTFLDIGVGIFNSLPVVNWKRKLLETVKITSNLNLVEDLLKGKIKSRTLRKDRGKGIPQIYESSKDEMFDEFYIMSNDVMVNTKTNKKIKLKEGFVGTLYYWTIKI